MKTWPDQLPVTTRFRQIVGFTYVNFSDQSFPTFFRKVIDKVKVNTAERPHVPGRLLLMHDFGLVGCRALQIRHGAGCEGEKRTTKDS